jgi:hypothetical protein
MISLAHDRVRVSMGRMWSAFPKPPHVDILMDKLRCRVCTGFENSYVLCGDGAFTFFSPTPRRKAGGYRHKCFTFSF